MYACAELFWVLTNVSNKFVFRRFPLRGGSSPFSPPSCTPERHHSLLGVLNVKLAYMPSCMCPEVRLTPDQRISCSDVKKCFMASSGSLVFCTT